MKSLIRRALKTPAHVKTLSSLYTFKHNIEEIVSSLNEQIEIPQKNKDYMTENFIPAYNNYFKTNATL